MKKVKVIKTAHTPAKAPIIQTLVFLMALDHWNIGGVWRGINYSLLGLIWIVSIIGMFCQEPSEPRWKNEN